MGVFKKRQARDAPGELSWVQVLAADDIPPGYTSLERNPQVQQCINIIADLVSSMTIYLMKNGEYGDIRVKNQLSRMVDVSPNSLMTRKTFIFAIVKEVLTTGNSVVLPIHDSDGMLTNMIPLPGATFINITPTSYKVMANGEIFSCDDVLHFRINPSKSTPCIGDGYSKMLIEAVRNMAQANATKRAFLKSKWKPSLIISANTDAKELQDKGLRKKLLDSYTETTEAGEPWVIPAGEIKVEKILPLTLKDLAIQDSMQMDMQVISSVFGVPAFMVGIGKFDKSEYNNFVSTKIMQTSMILQQEMTKKLLLSPEYYFKFSPKSLMQYDLSEKVSYVKDMIAMGVMNRNEGRDENDLSPVDDPAMNEFHVLENYIPVDRLGDQAKLKGGDDDGTKDD